MKNVSWEIVVPVVLVLIAIVVSIIAIVNHVGMDANDALKIVQYNTGMRMGL